MTITPSNITQAIKLIENRLGLSATTLARIGLGDLLQQISLGDINPYLQKLQTSDEQSPDWQRLIHALTIGETYFLRDKAHFNILREHILPRLILERRQQNNLRLTIWCVGCSTGEEAYSIATTLYENIPDLHKWQINLFATDINQRAIESAKSGIYREWSFRHTPDVFKQRYFTPVEDGWRLNDNIRDMVTFLRMNALSGIPTSRADIIFARHILMYLSKDYAQKVEETLHRTLDNAGWLVMGQAEALRTKRDNWTLHMFPGTPIYQKSDPTVTESEPISYPHRLEVERHIVEESQHYQHAVEAIHDDNPDKAEYHLSLLLDNQPNHAQAHILLASIFANRQIYPEALTHIELALAESGLYADAHYIKGLIQLEQDQEDNAVQSFSASIYCQRNHALSAMMLANIYYNRKEYPKAERQWRNALQAVSEKPETDFISDVSDMTVARLRGMVNEQQSLNEKDSIG